MVNHKIWVDNLAIFKARDFILTIFNWGGGLLEKHSVAAWNLVFDGQMKT
jgi:hypothetical protein